MTSFGQSIGQVLLINLKLAYSACLAGFAWYIWPTDNPEWWGLGMISIFLGLAAFSLTFTALFDAAKVISKERETGAYGKRGERPKSAKLAGDDDLKQAGMM